MKSIGKVKKAVIPVAGKGTRFLPATKNIPKEMIPLIDRPMIHYVVEEAVRSGIEKIIFVTSHGKSAIEDYFDRSYDLENYLIKNNKQKDFELVSAIGSMIEIITVRQKEQLGLGHAVLCAKDVIGDDTFAVLLGDDLVIGDNPATKQLMEVSASNEDCAVIGVMEVPKKDTNKYGIVDGTFLAGNSKTLRMNQMVEKPLPELAPTCLATPGRYVFPADIFSYLEKIPRGVGGEYQLTDAINLMAKERKVLAHKFIGDRFDTGNIEAHLEATVEFALRNPKYSDWMKKVIRDKARQYEIKL